MKFEHYEREALDEERATETVAAIVRTPQIEHGATHIVAAIAKHWHPRVLAFLGERERIEASDKRPSGFRGVPVAIEDEMREALAAHLDEFLTETRAWFDANPGPFEWNGGRLIAGTFPDFDDEFTRSSYRPSPTGTATPPSSSLRSSTPPRVRSASTPSLRPCSPRSHPATRSWRTS